MTSSSPARPPTTILNSTPAAVALGRSPLPSWRYWLAPAAWVCVIFFFSTDVFSSTNTSWFLVHVMRVLHIHLVHYDFLNWVMRKCAHFSTYFILSLLLFRAWRATLPDRHVARA